MHILRLFITTCFSSLSTTIADFNFKDAKHLEYKIEVSTSYNSE